MNKKYKLIQELAQRVTIYEPHIDILDEKVIDQYLLHIRALDSSFKKKIENKTLLLPELRKDGNESIAIYSDYGGESSDSMYLSYSFLVCGWNHSFSFPEEMKEIRKKYNLKDKEISFKDLRYGPIKRSLAEYLSLIQDTVPGILVNIIVDKKIESFFGGKVPPSYVVKELKDRNLGEWKPKVLEKVMRIVHTISYLVALLSKDGQKLYWVTDHDSIAANKKMHDNLAQLFQSVLDLYTKNKFPLVGYSTPFENKSVRQIDFLSCPDLAAGALEHYFTRKKKFDNLEIKPEADKILEWLGTDGICLKKHTLLIEQDNDNNINMGEVVFTTESLNKNINQIPVKVRYKI